MNLSIFPHKDTSNNCGFFKKLLMVLPVIMLAATLFFVDYTMKYFQDMSYEFVYNTNVESVRRFHKELTELRLAGYDEQDYPVLFTNMIHVYNKTLGEKKSIITFLLNEDTEIFHSTNSNEEYLLPYFENKNNMEKIYQTIGYADSGEITLTQKGNTFTMYYQKLTSINGNYYIFMGINKELIDEGLNADKILIPICVLCLITLIITENAVWLRMVCLPQIKRQGGGK